MRLEVYCDKKIIKLKLTKLDWVRANSYYLIVYIIFFSAHPFLFVCFVFGDDHVTCHVGADVISGENVEV